MVSIQRIRDFGVKNLKETSTYHPFFQWLKDPRVRNNGKILRTTGGRRLQEKNVFQAQHGIFIYEPTAVKTAFTRTGKINPEKSKHR